MGSPVESTSSYAPPPSTSFSNEQIEKMNVDSELKKAKERDAFLQLQTIADLFSFEIDSSSYSSIEEIRDRVFDHTVLALKRMPLVSTLSKAEKDALSNLTDFANRTLLMRLIEGWNREGAVALIKNKIALNALDENGNNAAHYAAMSGAHHLFADLAGKVDLFCKNHEGKTPLYLAIEAGQSLVVEAMVKNGVVQKGSIEIADDIRMSPLAYAVMLGKKDCVRELLKIFKIHERVSKIGTLLHVAVNFGQIEILMYLYELDPITFSDLLENEDDDGLTPLALAATIGEIDAIEFLHEKGANLETVDHKGRHPIHHAALNEIWDSIYMLSSCGAKFNVIDSNLKTPLQLLEHSDSPEAQECKSLLGYLVRRGKSTKLNSNSRPYPENIALEGGGSKGMSYVGVLTALIELKILDRIKRVVGTSAGGLAAAAIAFAFDVKQLQKLSEMDLAKFLDHPFSDLNSKKEEVNKLAKICTSISNKLEKVKKGIYYANPVNLLSALWNCTGICEGKALREWIEDIINEQVKNITGESVKNLTFGELKQYIRKGRPFKHLYLTGTRIDKLEIRYFSSEDPACDNMIISDTLCITTCYPLVFKPKHIYVKQNGQREELKNSGLWIDGGLLLNLPRKAFDAKRFLRSHYTGQEGDYPYFNKKTIAFSFFSSLEEEQRPKEPENIKDFLIAVAMIFRKSAKLTSALNQSAERSRTIEIDVKDVDTLSRDLTEEQKKEIIKSGQNATLEFFKKNPLQDPSKLFEIPGGVPILHGAKSLRLPVAYFCGRELIIESVKKDLLSGDWKPSNPIKIINLIAKVPGTGKTELAVTLGNQLYEDVSILIMIRTDSEALYADDYKHLARILKIPFRNDSIDDIVKKVHDRLNHLEFDKPYVLIFDNLEKPIPLPERGGCILTTARRPGILKDHTLNQKDIIVENFKLEEARKFFSSCIREERLKGFEKLFKKFEGNPFSLSQARVAIIREPNSTVESYLKALSPSNHPIFSKDTDSPYSSCIAEPYEHSLNRLKAENPRAYFYLEFFAYLQPDSINPKLLEVDLKGKGKKDNEDKVGAEVLSTLQSFELINYDYKKNIYFIHRNVQTIIHKRHIEKNIHKLKANEFAKLLKEKVEEFHVEDPGTWEIGQMHFSHIDWYIDQDFWKDIDPEVQWTFLRKRAKGLSAFEFRIAKALQLFDQCYEIALKLNRQTPNPRQVLLSINAVGYTAQALGSYGRAKEAFEIADEKLKELHDGRTAYHIAMNFNNLGSVFFALKEYKKAIEHFEIAKNKLLEIYQDQESNPDIAQIWGNLGNAYCDLQDYQQGLDCFQKSLTVLENIPDKKIQYAMTLQSSGTIWFIHGKYSQSRDCYEKALAVLREVHGETSNPDICLVQSNLANVLSVQGKQDEAITICLEVLNSYKEFYDDENHPDIIKIYNNLGRAHFKKKSYLDAKEYYKKAYELSKNAIYKERMERADRRSKNLCIVM